MNASLEHFPTLVRRHRWTDPSLRESFTSCRNGQPRRPPAAWNEVPGHDGWWDLPLLLLAILIGIGVGLLTRLAAR
jgi:hypothetical protein